LDYINHRQNILLKSDGQVVCHKEEDKNFKQFVLRFLKNSYVPPLVHFVVNSRLS